MDGDGDKEISRLRSQWYTLFMVWQVLHWLLIAVISAGSAVVASKWGGVDGLQDGIALAVAVASALYAVLDPAQRANSYRQAWVGLNLDHFKAKGLPQATMEAIRRGEEIIGRHAAPKGPD